MDTIRADADQLDSFPQLLPQCDGRRTRRRAPRVRKPAATGGRPISRDEWRSQEVAIRFSITAKHPQGRYPARLRSFFDEGLRHRARLSVVPGSSRAGDRLNSESELRRNGFPNSAATVRSRGVMPLTLLPLFALYRRLRLVRPSSFLSAWRSAHVLRHPARHGSANKARRFSPRPAGKTRDLSNKSAALP